MFTCRKSSWETKTRGMFEMNERKGNISKRNLDQTIPNDGDQCFTLCKKRTCTIGKMKLHRKNSLQSLELHTDNAWSFANNDYELLIIFHFASEDMMDIQNYDLIVQSSEITRPI